MLTAFVIVVILDLRKTFCHENLYRRVGIFFSWFVSRKMKLIVITLLFASASVASADQSVAEFVVNGEDANIRDFPYMAKVWNLMWPACGGAIVSPITVLTVSFPKQFS